MAGPHKTKTLPLAPKPAGRPSRFSQELADQIIDLLAEGKSITQICSSDRMPHRNTVMRWMVERPHFGAVCTRTREGPQADAVFDEITDLEQQVLSGEVAVDAARVVIASKQWRAGRLAPRRYGDKQSIDTTATVKVEHTRKLDISDLTDEQLDALEVALRSTVAQMSAPMKTIEHED